METLVELDGKLERAEGEGEVEHGGTDRDRARIDVGVEKG